MQKSFLSGLFTSPSPLFSIAAEKLPQMAQRLHQHCRLFLRKPLQSRADHFLMKILMMQISPIPPVCKRDQYHPTVLLTSLPDVYKRQAYLRVSACKIVLYLL